MSPYSIHCRCPFRVSEISSSFFPNLKIALLTFLCTSVNQTLTYIVLPLFLRQETVRRHDKKALLSIWHTKNVLDLFSKYGGGAFESSGNFHIHSLGRAKKFISAGKKMVYFSAGRPRIYSSTSFLFVIISWKQVLRIGYVEDILGHFSQHSQPAMPSKSEWVWHQS